MLTTGAGHVPELGRVVVRFDADLLHRVGTRLVRDAVVDRFVAVDAVDREVVDLLPLAVDRGPAAAPQAVELVRLGGDRASRVERDGREIASLDRQLLDLIARGDGADDRVLGLQQRRRRDHLDPLLQRAELQLEVDARRLRRGQRDGGLDALEALKFRRDDVHTDRHAGDDVVAGFVGHAGISDVGGHAGRGDREAGHGAGGFIGHNPCDGGQPGLRRRGRRQQEPGKCCQTQSQNEARKRTHEDLLLIFNSRIHSSLLRY